MTAYEIYRVPNQELDGTEVCLDEAETLEAANVICDDLNYQDNLWIIACSDENGYEKVVRT